MRGISIRSLGITACTALLLCAPPLAWSGNAEPIIYEVFYDAPGSDADSVFTELFGTPGMSLDGWSLVGINGGNGSVYRTIDLTGAVLPSDGLLVIGTSSANPSLATLIDFTANVDWQNGPDAVQLLDPSSLVVDALQYGDAGAFNAGEGTPATDVDAGSSLSRDILATDSGDNLADFLVSIPSPGIGPQVIVEPPTPTPVPEPTTLTLLGLGVCGLVMRGRRWLR